MLKISLLVLLTFHQAICSVDVNNFYPYGVDKGDVDYALSRNRDANLDDGSSSELAISTEFKFYGQKYRSLWVNINGGVSFKKPISTFTPYCEPLSQDMCMISPFWADIDLRDSTKGKLYYRQTTDSAVLAKAKTELTNAFPDLPNLGDPHWAFIATWLEVPFFNVEECPSPTERNTFQMTLVSTDQYSFAIFYYNKIQWTTGTASGGDCHGQPTSSGTPARAGFDNGLGKLNILRGSCHNDIMNLVSNNIGGTPGVYLLRVDGMEIVGPGSETPLDKITNTRPYITPSSPPTSTPTTSKPTTESEEQKRFEKHLANVKYFLNQTYTYANDLCPYLGEKPTLQSNCFDEWMELDNRFIETDKASKTDELYRIEEDLQKIRDNLEKISSDAILTTKMPPLDLSHKDDGFNLTRGEVVEDIDKAYNTALDICPNIIRYPAVQYDCFKQWKLIDNEIIELRRAQDLNGLLIIRNRVNEIIDELGRVKKASNQFVAY